MRLFIAINLNDEMKDSLAETISDLRCAARRGRYTPRENLHLTLVFIGETDRAGDILDVMEEVGEESFGELITLTLSGAGVFRGRGGDLHWVGVENTPELKRLVKALEAGLRDIGFNIEKRRFTPHITIGREITIDQEAGPVIKVRIAMMQADRISLMRSDRVEGRLVYTEIASVPYGIKMLDKNY
jgi:2'-5' RNA ligase